VSALFSAVSFRVFAIYPIKSGSGIENLLAVIHINIKPLNAELNPICHLLALLGAHHILNVSRIRVNV